MKAAYFHGSLAYRSTNRKRTKVHVAESRRTEPWI